MPDRFQSLVEAILGDDRDRVKELLKQDAALATASATDARFESRIAHWIYAGDTALHVAAAGYRVEIARMLLAAGADSGAAKNHRSSQPLHYAADGYLESASWDAKRQVRMIETSAQSGGGHSRAGQERSDAIASGGPHPMRRRRQMSSRRGQRCDSQKQARLDALSPCGPKHGSRRKRRGKGEGSATRNHPGVS